MIKKINGASTIVLTSLLLLSATLIILFSANYSLFQQKITANGSRNAQAFEAAQAGLEYGIQYLSQNLATVQATATSGLVNDTLTTVTLSNNSTYSVTFSNPTANNYTLFLVKCRGVSDDGTSTRVVQQYVGEMPSYPTSTLMSVGPVILTGGSTLTNTNTNTNIQSGGTITINNGAGTYTSTGLTSQQGHFGSDVQQNVSALTGMTETNFFSSVFGTTETAKKSSMATVYNNTVPNGSYSTLLSGVNNTSVWIAQTSGNSVVLGNGITVGTAAKPVLLVVEGAGLNIANGVTLYGYAYASGGITLAGGARIVGGMSTAGTTNISNGVGAISYQTYSSLSVGNPSFGRVPGSWKDF